LSGGKGGTFMDGPGRHLASLRHCCDARWFEGKFTSHNSLVKCNVFMSQSSRCGSHKFIAFKTTSQRPRCSDWFA